MTPAAGRCAVRGGLRPNIEWRLYPIPAIRIPPVCDPNDQDDDLVLTNFIQDAKSADTDASQPRSPPLSALPSLGEAASRSMVAMGRR
ncbi:MAG: hypothetical protein OXN89_24420 [Bryobacterales bacterium]|nr:hypothetical protein [Bryobacterales bacterium]